MLQMLTFEIDLKTLNQRRRKDWKCDYDQRYFPHVLKQRWYYVINPINHLYEQTLKSNRCLLTNVKETFVKIKISLTTRFRRVKPVFNRILNVVTTSCARWRISYQVCTHRKQIEALSFHPAWNGAVHGICIPRSYVCQHFPRTVRHSRFVSSHLRTEDFLPFARSSWLLNGYCVHCTNTRNFFLVWRLHSQDNLILLLGFLNLIMQSVKQNFRRHFV